MLTYKINHFCLRNENRFYDLHIPAVNSKPSFKQSRTPETMVQLLDGVATTEASDNDGESNNDEDSAQ